MNILDSLRTIFQEVNTARSLPEVLTIIVTEVHAAMGAEVCSVYLFDESDQHYVLMATKGLRQQSIGKVRLAMGQGLVGLVAAKEEPLNLQDADKHPNFAYFEEIGEEIYAALVKSDDASVPEHSPMPDWPFGLPHATLPALGAYLRGNSVESVLGRQDTLGSCFVEGDDVAKTARRVGLGVAQHHAAGHRAKLLKVWEERGLGGLWGEATQEKLNLRVGQGGGSAG